MAQTVYLRPSADSSVNHSKSSGSVGYSMLSEVTSDGDSTYIYASISGSNTNTTTTSSTFTLSANIGTDLRLLSAKVVAYAKISQSNSGTKNMKLTSGSNSSTSALTTSYTAYNLNIDLGNITYNSSNGNASASVSIETTGKKNNKNDSDFQLRITQLYIELSVESTVKYYMKVNGTWKKVKAYVKSGGSWQHMESSISGWSANDKIIYNPWDLNKTLPKGNGTNSTSGWASTEYIQISPSYDVTVQGAQLSSSDNNMFNVYNSDKSYNDWWGDGSTQAVITEGGYTVRRRTITASQINGGTFVRVNIPINLIQYCRVEQNGVVLFDGSQYPIV